MSGLEIILSAFVVTLIALHYINRANYDKTLKQILSHTSFEQNKIHQLAQSGALDSLLNVKKFNDWFNAPKDKEIYAHSGIFLRTDKLSQGHFNDYIKMTTGGLLSYDDFDSNKMLDFEKRVRNNWMKQLAK